MNCVQSHCKQLVLRYRLSPLIKYTSLLAISPSDSSVWRLDQWRRKVHSLGDKWRFARKRITANRSASAPLHSVPHSSSNAYVRRRRNSTALSNNDECAALNRLMLHLSTLPQFCLSLKSTLSFSLFSSHTFSFLFFFPFSFFRRQCALRPSINTSSGVLSCNDTAASISTSSQQCVWPVRCTTLRPVPSHAITARYHHHHYHHHHHHQRQQRRQQE